MSMRWIVRAGVTAAAATVAMAVVAPVAQASSDKLPLNQKDATIAGYQKSTCDIGPEGMPLPDKDVLVFVLPGNKGEFTKLTLTFKYGAGTTVVTVPGAGVGSLDLDNGTSKAWAAVPTGWTLVTGEAEVTDEAKADFFNLSHVCHATGGGSGGDNGGSDNGGSDNGGSDNGGSDNGGSAASTGGGTKDTTATRSDTAGRQLPVTGAPVLVVVVAGLVLLVAGGALLLVHRRRGSARFVA